MDTTRTTPPLDPLVAAAVRKLNPDDHEAWLERAAIMEHDGGIARAGADCLALLDLLARRPQALTGLAVLAAMLDGCQQWVLTSDAEAARRQLAGMGAVEIFAVDPVVALKQYGGLALLATLG